MKVAFKLTFLCLIFLQCKTTKPALNVNQIKDTAIKEFGTSVQVIYNAEKTFALFVTKEKSTLTRPGNALRYGVYDVKKEELVFTEQKYNASLKWFNNNYVQVNEQPGMQSVDAKENKTMMKYFLNVNTLEKLKETPTN